MSENEVPRGKYLSRAKMWGFGEAGTGTVQLIVAFDLKVPTDAVPATETTAEVPAGTRVVEMLKALYFTDGAMKTTRRALAAMGWNEPTDPDVAGAQVSEFLAGRGDLSKNEVELQVDDSTSDFTTENGKTIKTTKREIQFINVPGGRGLEIKQIGEQKKIEITASLSGMFAKSRAKDEAKANATGPRMASNGGTTDPVVLGGPTPDDPLPF